MDLQLKTSTWPSEVHEAIWLRGYGKIITLTYTHYNIYNIDKHKSHQN